MSYLPDSYKFRSGPGVLVLSPAAGRGATSQIEKETKEFYPSRASGSNDRI